MVLLKEVQSKLPRADSAESNDCGPPRKRPRREVLDESNPGSGFPNTPNCDIPTATPSQQAVHGNLQLREYLATAHLDCFFLSVHNTLPVLDEAAFRGSYNSFWTDSTQSEPWQCLLYAVLALGALRSKATENPAEWATKYFDQAQDLLSGILGLSCIETVQAAMFMVRRQGSRPIPTVQLALFTISCYRQFMHIASTAPMVSLVLRSHYHLHASSLTFFSCLQLPWNRHQNRLFHWHQPKPGSNVF